MPVELILGPRPGKKSKESIKAQGVTDIVSLLSPREQPDSIKRIASATGAEWHHFPIDGGHIETLEQVQLSQLFLLHDDIARSGDARVLYLHCSAGLHRTGYAAYLLLRYRSLGPEEAVEELRRLRPVTAEQVGADRIALAETRFQTWQSV